jgi:hypothetical protein
MLKGAKLQIKQLSTSGELLNVINCPAGRITVLRAYTPSQLEPYQRAVSGVPANEKILINLNNQEFIPDEHVLLGYGEDYKNISSTTSQYLLASGLPEAALIPTLNSFGLSNVAKASFSKLTACEARRVQLLGITYQIKKMAILNNPFDPLSSEWRERAADLLLKYVSNNIVPMLITSLDYRPECWINNEIINRIQVGDSAKRTIGFGSDNSEFNEIIKQVRQSQPTKENQKKSNLHTNSKSAESIFPNEIVRNPEKVRSRKNSAPISSSNIKSSKLVSKKQYGIKSLISHRLFKYTLGTATIAFIILTVGLKFKDQIINKISNENNQNTLVLTEHTNIEPITESTNSQPTSTPDATTVANDNTSKDSNPEIADPVLSAVNNNQGQLYVPKVEENPSPIPVIETNPIEVPVKDEISLLPDSDSINQPVIQQYSQGIRNSIMQSFQGEEEARAAYQQYATIYKIRKNTSTNSKKALSGFEESDNSVKDFLSALKTTDGSGKHLPNNVQTYSSTNTEGYDISTLENKNYADLTKEERRVLLREKFREAIERASQNR